MFLNPAEALSSQVLGMVVDTNTLRHVKPLFAFVLHKTEAPDHGVSCVSISNVPVK